MVENGEEVLLSHGRELVNIFSVMIFLLIICFQLFNYLIFSYLLETKKRSHITNPMPIVQQNDENFQNYQERFPGKSNSFCGITYNIL